MLAGVDMHADQLFVPVGAVRALVAEQFPAWRDLPVRAVESSGTVNALFRIGEGMAARFPLQLGDVEGTRVELEREAQAAREISGRTRFATPKPLALGEPGEGYPLPWSVQTWLPGTVAADDDSASSVDFAHDLTELILGIRAIDVAGRTFRGQGRGGDLQQHDDWVQECLDHSTEILDVAALRPLWAALRDLPRGLPDDVMTHGDLIPGNLLVADGRLAGVLDVGGLGPADPALDLVCAWHSLEPDARWALRESLACGDLEWARGQAWAFEQAIGAAWYYAQSNPVMSLMGRRTLARILADPLT